MKFALNLYTLCSIGIIFFLLNGCNREDSPSAPNAKPTTMCRLIGWDVYDGSRHTIYTVTYGEKNRVSSILTTAEGSTVPPTKYRYLYQADGTLKQIMVVYPRTAIDTLITQIDAESRNGKLTRLIVNNIGISIDRFNVIYKDTLIYRYEPETAGSSGAVTFTYDAKGNVSEIKVEGPTENSSITTNSFAYLPYKNPLRLLQLPFWQTPNNLITNNYVSSGSVSTYTPRGTIRVSAAIPLVSSKQSTSGYVVEAITNVNGRDVKTVYNLSDCD
ncbi:hypothetical protein WBJ53_08785 [Spirosoma sp. SC4-14]|uniref:hypothetical protein n=1 Tax=Spirosoma sp. SC4-14 TaxID=3128900 RepID=UPI0030D576C3